MSLMMYEDLKKETDLLFKFLCFKESSKFSEENPVTDKALRSAVDLINSVCSKSHPIGIPTPSGGIRFAWFSGDLHLVDIQSDGSINYRIEDTHSYKCDEIFFEFSPELYKMYHRHYV